jgi:uncharacterized membrane protein
MRKRRPRQAWQYLIVIFAAFWLIFAIFLIVGGLPFYIISLALTTTGVLSVLVVLLAWAFQNNV